MQLSLSSPEKLSRQPRTIVITCAEASACDASWTSLLRDRALVLRSHGGAVNDAARAALPGLLAAGAIERVVVLGHVGCAACGSAEPRQNTAVLAAWYRLAPAVRTLARERTVGLEPEAFDARLDTLVQLANLEGCAELHSALRDGRVSARAAVYDPRNGTVALFDGTRFTPIDAAAFARLIAGPEPEKTIERSKGRRTPCSHDGTISASTIWTVASPLSTTCGRR